MECTQNKSYLTFSSSDSSFKKYPEVSLNNLSFFIFFFQSAMGLCLSLESPSFDYIYVNSLRDFFVVRFSNPLDRPPFSEALILLLLCFCCLHCTILNTICQALFLIIYIIFLYIFTFSLFLYRFFAFFNHLFNKKISFPLNFHSSLFNLKLF